MALTAQICVVELLGSGLERANTSEDFGRTPKKKGQGTACILGVRMGLTPNYTGQEGREGPRVSCGFLFLFVFLILNSYSLSLEKTILNFVRCNGRKTSNDYRK